MPTRLIKKYIEEFAKFLRNQQDYDDWDFGMEPIPHDKLWSKSKTLSFSGIDQACEEESSKP